MSRNDLGLSDELYEYAIAHSTPPDELLRALVDETKAIGSAAGMQIGPNQGVFMTVLSRLVEPRFAVEVGTFTGYSSICIARGLAPGGRLLCCDLSEEWTAIAQRYWQQAGLDDRIELRLAPAIDTLRSLPAEPHIDLTFIDADKAGYISYWEELVPRMRAGGILLADNVLWNGRVVESVTDANTTAIQAFNDHVGADRRVEAVVLPIGDGLTLARRIDRQ